MHNIKFYSIGLVYTSALIFGRVCQATATQDKESNGNFIFIDGYKYRKPFNEHPACNGKIDLVFVVKWPSGMDKHKWYDRIADYMPKFISQLEINENRFRVGLIMSNNYNKDFTIDLNGEDSYDKVKILEQVSKSVDLNTLIFGVKLETMLESARLMLKNSKRLNSTKMLFLVTDGTHVNKDKIGVVFDKIRADKVQLIVQGIGPTSQLWIKPYIGCLVSNEYPCPYFMLSTLEDKLDHEAGYYRMCLGVPQNAVCKINYGDFNSCELPCRPYSVKSAFAVSYTTVRGPTFGYIGLKHGADCKTQSYHKDLIFEKCGPKDCMSEEEYAKFQEDSMKNKRVILQSNDQDKQKQNEELKKSLEPMNDDSKVQAEVDALANESQEVAKPAGENLAKVNEVPAEEEHAKAEAEAAENQEEEEEVGEESTDEEAGEEEAGEESVQAEAAEEESVEEPVEEVEEQAATEELANEELTQEELVNEKLPNEKLPNEKVVNENGAQEQPVAEVANEKLPNEKLPNEKLPNEKLPVEEQAVAAKPNHENHQKARAAAGAQNQPQAAVEPVKVKNNLPNHGNQSAKGQPEIAKRKKKASKSLKKIKHVVGASNVLNKATAPVIRKIAPAGPETAQKVKEQEELFKEPVEKIFKESDRVKNNKVHSDSDEEDSFHSEFLSGNTQNVKIAGGVVGGVVVLGLAGLAFSKKRKQSVGYGYTGIVYDNDDDDVRYDESPEEFTITGIDNALWGEK